MEFKKVATDQRQAAGRRRGYRFKAPEVDVWLDCGKPESLLETNRYLLQGLHHAGGEVSNSVIVEPVHIEEGAVVRASVIGPNVSVAAGSVIEESIVRDSIINSNTIVRNMILQDSILGDAVMLVSSARKVNIGNHSMIELQG